MEHYYIIYIKEGDRSVYYDYDRRCKKIKFDDGSKFVSFFDKYDNYIAIIPYSEIKLIEKRYM